MAAEKLPRRNLILILLFGAGIILFILLAIFPNYMAYSEITQEIESIKGQIEEQKILSPIFNDLAKKTEFDQPDNLPFPQQEKLAKNETGKLSTVIRDIVQRNDLQLQDLTTDVDSLMQAPDVLKLNVQMSGDFMNLRTVLLQLGELPYLEHIESIRIESKGADNTVQLKLWFAQK